MNLEKAFPTTKNAKTTERGQIFDRIRFARWVNRILIKRPSISFFFGPFVVSSFAFTFLELLVVVACISILAGIAVPNFLEAQVRSKVARARADLAVTAEALEAYYADHFAYPVNYEPFPPPPGSSTAPRTYPLHYIMIPRPIPVPGAPLPFPPGQMQPALGDKGSTATAGLASQPAPGGPAAMPGTLFPDNSNPFTAVYPRSFNMQAPPTESVPSVAASDDQPTSRLARPYLDAWGGEDAFSRFGGRGGRSWGLNPFGAPAPGALSIPAQSATDYSNSLSYNGAALFALTTPIAYLTTVLSDPFQDVRGAPYFYINYSPCSLKKGWYLPSARRSPAYMLGSHGPDTGATVLDPYVGPFVPYDPQNGTVSSGDILMFDGEIYTDTYSILDASGQPVTPTPGSPVF